MRAVRVGFRGDCQPIARPAKPVEPPPRFPAVRRDLALVIDREVPAATVIDTIRQINLPLLESVELFDVYTGEGIPPDKKSMALSLQISGQGADSDRRRGQPRA